MGPWHQFSSKCPSPLPFFLLKKEKKGSFKEEKGSKKIRAPRHPSGGPAGQFLQSTKVHPPRKCEEGVAVNLLHDLPLLPRPPPQEGCLDRLRLCGHRIFAHPRTHRSKSPKLTFPHSPLRSEIEATLLSPPSAFFELGRNSQKSPA